MTILWGIDLGGTKIEGLVFDDANAAQPLARVRVKTEAQHGYQHILERIAGLVKELEAKTKLRPKAIGFGTPGVLDPKTFTMKNSANAALNGQYLKRDLEQKLQVPVELANDANCFALAENLLGAARGAKICFGVIMGTGVGGGVVVNEQALYGCQGIAGEWGHNVLVQDGPECYCGKRGCVETIISGPALEKFYKAAAGQELALSEIEARARSGKDEHALATIDRLCTYFGRALAVVINIIDPEVVVLGGGVSNISRLYSDGIEEVGKYVFNNRFETRILKNQLGDSGGVFGAALLVQHIG